MRRSSAVLGIVTTLIVLVLVGALLVVARPDDRTSRAEPTATASASATPSATPALVAELQEPTAAATVVTATDASGAALETSAAVFAAAPVVVLAPDDDQAALLTGASAAVAVGAPLLLTATAEADGAVTAELERLATQAVLAVGDVPPAVVPDAVSVVHVGAGAGRAELAAVLGVQLGPELEVDDVTTAAAGLDTRPVPTLVLPRAQATPEPDDPTAPSTTSSVATATQTARTPLPPTPSATSARTLPATRLPQRVPGLVGLTGAGGDTPAALATLRAARVPLVAVPGGDPRAATATVEALADADPDHVVALGAAFGPVEQLATRVATAATGVLSPGGGQLVFPDVAGVPHKRYVALYGTPGSTALGVLGEQDVPATIARAQRLARTYRPLTDATVVPAVEIIATIASAAPEDDGSYSRRRTVADLRPLVDAAHEAGVAVVLDLQPGRDDFLTQAKEYTELLELPNVGLALDPEWRLAPDQVHLEQIGSVATAEVNEVAQWLADLTASRRLPQKMFVLHQFSPSMIRDRDQLDVSHDELATVIHVDGQGTQPAKRGTWNRLRAGAPDVHWGWKNFVDEDSPTLTPEQTYQIDPVPDLVTYQ